MIREKSTLSIKELSETCSQLIFAKDYFKKQALHYHMAFNACAQRDPGAHMLPNSPIMELYQELAEYYKSQMFQIEHRIAVLQGIADSTMFEGLDY